MCNENNKQSLATNASSFWKNAATGGMVAVGIGITLCALTQHSHK